MATRPAVHPSPIASIHVRDLHGSLRYDVDLADANGLQVATSSEEVFAAGQDRLSLLYGPNGAGKTTILRMLFDGLSSAHNRGHRAALGRVRFRSFVVEFVAGAVVSYTRPEATIGPFEAKVQAGSSAASWTWRRDEPAYEVDPRTGVARPARLMAGEHDFLAALEELQVNPVFLTDTRVLTSDIVASDPDEARYYYTASAPGPTYVDALVRKERNVDLREALERVHDYLRRVVLTGAQLGAERADTVYASVTETIATAPAAAGRPPKSTIPDLLTRVESLGDRVATFTKYGLIAAIPVVRFVTALQNAEPRNGRLLTQVLTPYLDGLEERMDGLESGRRAIAGYVDTINSFFEGKHLSFSPARGVEITDTNTQESLEPDQLSSGEKQILVLFSDVVALRERTRLFIIDEPELSLNPSWQRKLMPSFLASTEGSPMQLISATHSIEIMAKYRARLVPLEPGT